MDLPSTIIVCAAVIVAAKTTDFLLGKKGRSWVKERLIFRPWYFLQGAQPLTVLRTSALIFSKTVNLMFGPRLISLRAYYVSGLIGLLLVLLYVRLDKPLNLSTLVDHAPSSATYFGVLYGISPIFDFLSFGVTRFLAQKIATSGRLLPALTLWLVDLIACAAMAGCTYIAAELFVNHTEPRFGLSIWYGYVTHDVSVFAAASKAVPTLIHLVFFTFFFCLALIELTRKALSFLLERFDETNDSPLTLVSAAVAAIMGLLSSMLKEVG